MEEAENSNSSDGKSIHQNNSGEDITNSKWLFSWQKTFASLIYRNYRLWFWGQMISLFGSWMQSTALAFYIFELTHSPAFLGYVGFATGIPAWLFSFYGGVLADRIPRKRILLICQTFMMIMAFVISGLTYFNLVTPGLIIIIAFLLGLANAFDAPARHAFVNELVDKKHLINAIALNSTMFNTATAIGPAIAGITYAIFGPAWCFLINGISFIAVIVNLMQMNIIQNIKPRENKSILHEIKEGFVYLKSQKTIVAITSITAMLSLFGMGLVTLFPAWAVNILHGDSTTNGYLQSARGVGAVLCALIIATVNQYIIRGRVLVLTTASIPFLLLLFSFNRSFLLSILLLILMGGAMIIMFNLANGLIQTIVAEEFRGRIMSIYSFSFFALYPIGALWIGMLAEHFGSPIAIFIDGVIMLLFSIIIWILAPSLRKVS